MIYDKVESGEISLNDFFHQFHTSLTSQTINPYYLVKAIKHLQPKFDKNSAPYKTIETLLSDKSNAEQIELLDEALDKDENFLYAHLLLAESFIEEKKWGAAIRHYSKYFDQYSEDDVLANEIGYCYRRLKDYKKAKEYCLKSFELNDENKEAPYNLAYASKALKDFDSALKWANICVEGETYKKDAQRLIDSIKSKTSKAGAPQTSIEEIPDNVDAHPGFVTTEKSKLNPKSKPKKEYDAVPNNERDLQNHIYNSIIAGENVFGRNLKLFEQGIEYRCKGVGRIDILCEDKDTNEFVIIELKNDNSGKEVVDQIFKYITFVEKNIANGRGVRGVIGITNAKQELIDEVKNNHSSKLQLLQLNLSFKILA